MPPSTRYCGHCGQDHRYRRLQLRALVDGALSDITSLDRPSLRTLRAIFPECGTLARDYVEGRRVDHVGPLRFMLVMLGLLVLVNSALSTYSGSQDGAHSQWLSVALIAYTLPMAYLLRFFCVTRQQDIVEVVAFVCYALSGAVLGWMVVFSLMASVFLNLAVWVGVFYALVFVPVYWTISLKRFFRCAWWRALIALCMVGFLGMFVFSRLMQAITELGNH
ncbi:MAG: DUF3667 domain-containing protein [Proteobacteria bacterium]|nr:DUF3667 domain-containing protein [Pseudomonadota bacterium]MBS0464065.1 DUF3667 domain-containing protein [Pseudomonadota bacterium]